ncbi:MAG TPA: MotA/TolQ/ExbB proton channel family protein [Candidatus Omnitrophota bacterium]|nr:MotA/TolQ/ExbB proton channel family protein [Candidatus Omnitrophota bacterium]
MTVIIANGWQLLFKAGPMIWPLFLLSIVVLATGLRQWIQFARLAKGLDARQKQVLDVLRGGTLKEAMASCESVPDLMGEVLKAGILKFGVSRDMITGVMEETFACRAHDLYSRLGILSFTTNAAVLVGILGTVNALVVLFQAAQARSNALSPLAAGDMAGAVWQALLTTVAGLFVAVVSFTFYSFCTFRTNAIAGQVETAIAQTANVLQQLSELQSQGDAGDENV